MPVRVYTTNAGTDLSDAESALLADLIARHGRVVLLAPTFAELDLCRHDAAASGASLIQYFLTGGPVAALATVIPVIPGSDLKSANAFQRPSILSGCLVAFVITAILTIV